MENVTQIATEQDRAYKYRLCVGFDSRYLLKREKPVDIRKIERNLIFTGFSYVKYGGGAAIFGTYSAIFGESKWNGNCNASTARCSMPAILSCIAWRYTRCMTFGDAQPPRAIM